MWRSGDAIVLRYRAIDGRFHAGRPLRVIEDSPGLTVAWLAQGAECSMPRLADGRGLRDVPLDERWLHPREAFRLRSPNEQILLFPWGRTHSLWVMRRDGELLGWYVNLEDRHVRHGGTITTRDSILDLWVPVETREAVWKDEDELAAAVRHGRLTEAEAAAARAEGERVVHERPWPTGWEDWRPPGDWRAPELPDGWDA
jgi:hypothetical protein